MKRSTGTERKSTAAEMNVATVLTGIIVGNELRNSGERGVSGPVSVWIEFDIIPAIIVANTTVIQIMEIIKKMRVILFLVRKVIN